MRGSSKRRQTRVRNDYAMHLRDTPAATVLAVALLFAGSVAVVLRAASRWLQKPMPGKTAGDSEG
jgi:hypothetical protein